MAINPSQDILKNALTPLQPGGFVQNKDIPVQNQSKQTYLPQKPVVTPPAQPISQKHTVTFSNGATVTFDGIPTKADIDHVASTDAVKNYKNPEASAPPPTPTFQDQHPTE